MYPSVRDTSDSCWQPPRRRGARSIESIRFSRFQLHTRDSQFRCKQETTVRAGLDAGGAGEVLGRQFGVCIPPCETPAAVAGKPHAAGARSIESVRDFLVSSSTSEKPISVQTSDYGACAGLDAGGAGEVVRKAVWCMYPSVRDTSGSCWQTPRRRSSVHIESVRFSRFQLHIREANFGANK